MPRSGSVSYRHWSAAPSDVAPHVGWVVVTEEDTRGARSTGRGPTGPGNLAGLATHARPWTAGVTPAERVRTAAIDGGAFDHVILATSDAAATVARLRRDHGLGAIRGGSHPWGTANWIVPLEPPTYLEILYPEHPDRLAEDPEGSELLDRMRRGESWAGWALRPPSIEDVARKLGLVLERGQAARPDGSVSSWRTAAPTADLGGSLPFFIDYDDPAGRLARSAANYAAAAHERRVGPVAWIDIELDAGGDGASMLAGLATDVDIRIVPGASSGIRAVGLRVDDAVIELLPGG